MVLGLKSGDFGLSIFLQATISCFCQCNHIPFEVVDVGINRAEAVGRDYKVRRGTQDFLQEPAVSIWPLFAGRWSAARSIAFPLCWMDSPQLLLLPAQYRSMQVSLRWLSLRICPGNRA